MSFMSCCFLAHENKNTQLFLDMGIVNEYVFRKLAYESSLYIFLTVICLFNDYHLYFKRE